MTYVAGAVSDMQDVVSCADFGIQWQTTPPTAPGWYWIRINDSVDIVHLSAMFSGVFRWGERPVKNESIKGWLGPLPVPELPTA